MDLTAQQVTALFVTTSVMLMALEELQFNDGEGEDKQVRDRIVSTVTEMLGSDLMVAIRESQDRMENARNELENHGNN